MFSCFTITWPASLSLAAVVGAVTAGWAIFARLQDRWERADGRLLIETYRTDGAVEAVVKFATEDRAEPIDLIVSVISPSDAVVQERDPEVLAYFQGQHIPPRKVRREDNSLTFRMEAHSATSPLTATFCADKFGSAPFVKVRLVLRKAGSGKKVLSRVRPIS